ncbi:MAG: capsule assembly Wzi family protein [Gemmatimonadota bacterium]
MKTVLRRMLAGTLRARAALLARALLVGTAVLATTGPAAAQAPTPTLAPDHWSVGALRRLDAAGLLPPGSDWGRRAPREGDVGRALAHAAVVAGVQDHPLLPLIADWSVRFVAETGTVALPVLAPARVVRITAEGGYRYRTGVVLTGMGYENVDNWTGAPPAPDTATALLAVAIGTRVRERAWLGASVEARHGNMRLPAAEAVVRLGGFHLWGGRRVVGMGPGRGGSIVLSGTSLDGVGLATAAPLEPSGFLDVFGPLSAEFVLSRLENGDSITEPWFAATRLAISPHPRFGFGLTRGDIFGGRGNAPITLEHMLKLLVGKHSGEVGEFNNLVLALDARWRPPLGALPLRLWLEWGLDDSAGAISNSPANVVGAELGAVPGLPQLALGIERTWFHPDCRCGNTVWYRNWALTGGWTDERRPLGHMLGGDGTEWRGDARLDAGRATLSAAGWTRERGPHNLFAPERSGRATGGEVRAAIRLAARWSITGSAWLEEGADGWREHALALRLRGRLH